MQHGASVDYNILGASVAEMPLSEIATYLGCQLFAGYRGMYERVPACGCQTLMSFYTGLHLKFLKQALMMLYSNSSQRS